MKTTKQYRLEEALKRVKQTLMYVMDFEEESLLADFVGAHKISTTKDITDGNIIITLKVTSDIAYILESRYDNIQKIREEINNDTKRNT